MKNNKEEHSTESIPRGRVHPNTKYDFSLKGTNDFLAKKSRLGMFHPDNIIGINTDGEIGILYCRNLLLLPDRIRMKDLDVTAISESYDNIPKFFNYKLVRPEISYYDPENTEKEKEIPEPIIHSNDENRIGSSQKVLATIPIRHISQYHLIENGQTYENLEKQIRDTGKIDGAYLESALKFSPQGFLRDNPFLFEAMFFEDELMDERILEYLKEKL